MAAPSFASRLLPALGAGLLVLGLVVIRPSAAHAIAPATIVAIAKTAKEIASTIKDLVGQPDPLLGVPQTLAEIQVSLDRIEVMANDTLESVLRQEEGEVREANEDALNSFLDALQHVTAARIALSYLAENPGDLDIRLQADTETRLAIVDFETRPQFFRLTGPRITDERFNHVLMYAGYLQALALRATFVQLAEGPRAFTHEPYRSETYASVVMLNSLIGSIDAALQIRTAVFGPDQSHEFICTYGSIELRDYIRYDKGPVSEADGSLAPHYLTSADYRENHTLRDVEFPGQSCSADSISFYFEEPIAALRAERHAEYGVPEIEAVAATLMNYADYGQPTPPRFEFSQWMMGSPFVELPGLWLNPYRTLKPAAAEPGAQIELVGAAAQQTWKIPLSAGPLVHVDSELCLTQNVAAGTTTLEVCSDAADQVWSASHSDGWSIRHEASGLCLSAAKSWTLLDLNGRPSRTYYSPDLHVAPCDRGRLDQRWLMGDPNTPGPIVR
jgi:hypothetical protein